MKRLFGTFLLFAVAAAYCDVQLGDANRSTVLSTPDSVSNFVNVAVSNLATTNQLADAIAAIPAPDPEADPVALPIAQAAAVAITNEAIARAAGDAATLSNAVAQVQEDLVGYVQTNTAAYLIAISHPSRSDNPHSVTASQIGAVATNSILGQGETQLGSGLSFTIGNESASYSASPTGTWALAVSPNALRYPRDLLVTSTNVPSLPSYIANNLTGTPGITNLYYLRPVGTSTNWMLAGGSASTEGYVTSSSIPGPGCTLLSGVTPTVTGATVNYLFFPTNAYTLGVSTNLNRTWNYNVLIIGTNAMTLASGITRFGAQEFGGTNRIVIGSYTGSLWQAQGGPVQ